MCSERGEILIGNASDGWEPGGSLVVRAYANFSYESMAISTSKKKRSSQKETLKKKKSMSEDQSLWC